MRNEEQFDHLVRMSGAAERLDEPDAPDVRTPGCLGMARLERLAGGAVLAAGESAHMAKCSLCAGRLSAFSAPLAPTTAAPVSATGTTGATLWPWIAGAAAACVAAGVWVFSGDAPRGGLHVHQAPAANREAAEFEVTVDHPMAVVVVVRDAHDGATGGWRVQQWADGSVVQALQPGRGAATSCSFSDDPGVQQWFVAIAGPAPSVFGVAEDAGFSLAACLASNAVAARDDADVTAAVRTCLPDVAEITPVPFRAQFIIP